MHDRAYSVLDVKAVDDTARMIRGIATTPSVDRLGDEIDPLGVAFKNPMPFLWQHFHDAPIGTAVFDEPTKSGIRFVATLPRIEEAGTLRDRIEEAWQSIKAGLVRGVSIGFIPREYAFTETGIRYDVIDVFEASAVTIPANAEALITTLKAFDAAALKAAGIAPPEIPQRPEPAASGRSARVVRLGNPAGGSAPFIIRKIRRGIP